MKRIKFIMNNTKPIIYLVFLVIGHVCESSSNEIHPHQIDEQIISIAKNWRFDCSQLTPSESVENTRYLKQAVLSGLLEGTQKVQEINPTFASEILVRIKTLQPNLLFYCDNYTQGISGYINNSVFFGSGFFNLYLMDATLKSSDELKGSSVHAVFFHEILHSIRADSLSVGQHNEISWSANKSLLAAKKRDVVIACSALVSKSAEGSRAQLCEVCAGAKFIMSPSKKSGYDAPIEVESKNKISQETKDFCQKRYGLP